MLMNGYLDILYIEDDELQVMMMRKCLEEFEYTRVVHKYDALESLNYLEERLRNNEPLPEIILLDVRMPKMDGLELLEKIKKKDELKVIPIIMLTSSDSQLDVRKAYENGACSYLVKPLGLENLLTLTEKIVDYWHDCNIFYSLESVK